MSTMYHHTYGSWILAKSAAEHLESEPSVRMATWKCEGEFKYAVYYELATRGPNEKECKQFFQTPFLGLGKIWVRKDCLVLDRRNPLELPKIIKNARSVVWEGLISDLEQMSSSPENAKRVVLGLASAKGREIGFMEDINSFIHTLHPLDITLASIHTHQARLSVPMSVVKSNPKTKAPTMPILQEIPKSPRVTFIPPSSTHKNDIIISNRFQVSCRRREIDKTHMKGIMMDRHIWARKEKRPENKPRGKFERFPTKSKQAEIQTKLYELWIQTADIDAIHILQDFGKDRNCPAEHWEFGLPEGMFHPSY